jgi:beta-lactamase class D
MRHVTLLLGLLLTLLLLTVPAVQAGADAPALVERPDWQAHFDAAGVSGAMVVHKDGAPEILVYDATRAATPFLPASTFKILNSLIALETGVVSGPDEIFPYDGQPRFLPAWNADLTLRQAFALSCVPVYQDIARRIGPERMAWYVAACNYGNADIAGGIDQFWLSGALRISALEQIEFLKRLHRRQLPFANATIDAVLDLMIVGQTDQTTLRAKTGLTARVLPGTAWYVGLVTRGPNIWYFALNLAIPQPDAAAPLAARKDVALAILRGEGIMK